MFPVQLYGVLDPGVSEINDSEMLAHAMENVADESKEFYYVRHGLDFVNEYPRHDINHQPFPGTVEDPNHLLGAFPCLFLYGFGGFEVNRPRKVHLIINVANRVFMFSQDLLCRSRSMGSSI